MLAHLTDLYTAKDVMLPLMTFLIGLSGSLHCVGMCGGLILASSPTKKHILFYHFGRLIGYLFLALVTSFIGSVLIIRNDNILLALLPALSIGLILIYAGLSQIKGKKPELPLPIFLKNALFLVWKNLFPKDHKVPILSSATAGLLSILLPCGLLYGVILAVASFQNPILGVISLLTYWLGTLPALFFAPSIIRKFLKPFMQKSPMVLSCLLIFIGLGTILFKVYLAYQEIYCH